MTENLHLQTHSTVPIPSVASPVGENAEFILSFRLFLSIIILIMTNKEDRYWQSHVKRSNELPKVYKMVFWLFYFTRCQFLGF